MVETFDSQQALGSSRKNEKIMNYHSGPSIPNPHEFQRMRRDRALTAVLVFCLLMTGEMPLAGQAAAEQPQIQQASVPKLTILILDGEGAINNIRRRVARESLIQVVDENRKPVAGAVVTFELPKSGPSGVFPDGLRTWKNLTPTDSTGRVSLKGIRLNKLPGKMQIKVSAALSGETGPVIPASSLLTQINVLGPWVLLGIPITVTTVAIGGAAVAAAVVGSAKARGGGGKSATISVGPPHF